MSRVVHFEIPAQDPAKIGAFYREVFGWEVNKWDGPQEYWLVKTGDEGTPGIDGGLYKPGNGMGGTINTLDVADLDAAISKVNANGGKIVVPRMAVPDVGYLAYAADVEGNVFGMMQSDPNAGQG